MPWFYNDHSGELRYDTGVSALADEAALHLGIGWHEYATKPAALAAIKAHPGWPAPTTSLAGAIGNTAGQAAGAAASGLLGIPHLTSSQWRAYLLRGLKVAIGVVLVIVGLVQLTHAQNLVTAAATKAIP